MFKSWARRTVRNPRLIAPLCILLICGCFAAAAAIQMQLERGRTQSQSARNELGRARDLAAVTAAGLDRFEAAGMAYAADPGTLPALAGLKNVLVFDGQDHLLALLHRDGGMPQLPPHTSLFAWRSDAVLTRRSGNHVVAVVFDPRALAPASLLDQAALVLPDNAALLGNATAGQTVGVSGWPLSVRVADPGTAPSWLGLLPLYLFVILGPALAGAWLAALFVGSFERQQKAARAIRALKSTRPVEAKLLVRLAAAERAGLEAVRAKSEFIAHMSHELRTPLNAVIGFSEVIEQGLYGPPGHPKYAEYARDIAEAGRGLHARIGDILEFANIEAGRYPLAAERTDVTGLALAMVEEQQGRAFSRRIRLDVCHTGPADARADSGAVRRILANLLANALCYTAEGGSVRLDVKAEDGAVVLGLSDSGLGFSPAEQMRAGKPFQRFDRAGTVTGAGLGLAIAMELARRMGGTLRLISLPGEGALMEVRLPGFAGPKAESEDRLNPFLT